MAKNKAQNFHDDRGEGHVDNPNANFQCEKEDENLGFVADDGVTFQEFTYDYGKLKLHGICGSRSA